MIKKVRLSEIGLRVLRWMLDHPQSQHSGSTLIKELHSTSGALYPLLMRFEEAGWMKSIWENIEPRSIGRPKKRLYELTFYGTTQARLHLKHLQEIYTEHDK
jgi:PadR family transcriptional regulator PadR